MHISIKVNEITRNDIDSSDESSKQPLNKRLKLDVFAFIKQQESNVDDNSFFLRF